MTNTKTYIKLIYTLLLALITKGVFANNIDSTLVNKNATTETVELYNFLRSVYGKKTLSGAMCKYTISSSEAEWIHRKSDKHPAILCYDMMNVTNPHSHDNYYDMIVSAKKWHAKGGIVAVMWHWRNPLKTNDAFYSMNMKDTPKSRTDFDVSKVHDPSSDEYKAIVEDIDVVASYLLKLQKLNIPVLWRPIHESQGGWFWWGAGDSNDNKALWDLLYDRMVNHHKLNNLIWVWTVDRREGRGRASDWYPGDDKVDILGIDIYDDPTHESKRKHFDFTNAIGNGRKMVALTECGTIPHPQKMLEGGDKWLWFMPWVAEFLHDHKYLKVETLKEIMNHDFVLTRDDLK